MPSAAPFSTESTLTPVASAELNELRELRVVLPTDVHRQLLSLKILRGVSLAETVTRALEQYFQARRERARDAPLPEDAL